MASYPLSPPQLAERLERWFGVSVADVLATVADVRAPDSVPLAGGSLPVGLGNRRSDLDLLLVGTAQGIVDSDFPVTSFVGRLRIDVRQLSTAAVLERFEQARTALEQDDLAAWTERDVRRIQRIAFGVALDGAAPTEITLDQRLLVQEVCATWQEAVAQRAAVMTHLAQETEDALVAAWNARSALEAALEAVLARAGTPYIGPKWLHHRLESQRPDLWQEVRPRLQLDLGGEPPAAAQDRLVMAGQLLGTALDRDTLLERFRWVLHGQVRNVGNRWLLLDVERHRVVELDPAEAAWLGAVDGASTLAALGTGQRAAVGALLAQGWTTLERTRSAA